MYLSGMREMVWKMSLRVPEREDDTSSDSADLARTTKLRCPDRPACQPVPIWPIGATGKGKKLHCKRAKFPEPRAVF